MKKHDLSNDKNPDQTLFKVVHIVNPEDMLTAIRREAPTYKKAPTKKETL